MKRVINSLRRLCIGFIGVIFTVPPAGRAEETNNDNMSGNDFNDQSQIKADFSKEELIDSLRAMERNPENVRTICAMCYEMAIASEDVTFECDRCSKTKVYSRDSNEGSIIEELPYVKRSLENMPYDITMDTTGFCPACGKGKTPVLRMNVKCFNCKKEFFWDIHDKEELQQLKWLYLTPPIKEVDFAPWEWPEQGHEKDVLQKGARYIHEHVFCPVCQKKIPLSE